MKKVLSVSFICLLMVSISFAQQASPDCAKIYGMKHYRFSKSKYQEQLKNAWNLIDTNSVYLTYSPTRGYRFIRFFTDGIYFISKAYETAPTDKDYNNLCYGSLAMFTFENNSIIVEERLSDWGADARRWGYSYGMLKQDSLIFYKYERGRRSPLKYDLDLICIKKKVSLTNFNWSVYSERKDLRKRKRK